MITEQRVVISIYFTLLTQNILLSCFRVYFIPWSPLLHVKLVHNNSIKFIEEDYILATILDTSHVSANSISATTLWGKYYV